MVHLERAEEEGGGMMRALAAAMVTAILVLASVVATTASGTPARSPEPVSVSITYPANGTVVSSEVNITGNASGPEGLALAVSVSIDGGSSFPAQGNTSWSYRWSTLVEWPHMIEVTAAAGNDTATARITVIYSAPSTHVNISGHEPAGPEISLTPGNNATFSITLSSSPQNATIEWYVDDSAVPAEEGRLSFNFVAPANFRGDHYIDVRLVRNGTTIDSVRWNLTGLQLDKLPLISAFQPDTLNLSIEQDSREHFDITASDPDGDPLNITWSMDGKTLSSGLNMTSFSTYFNRSGDYFVTVSVSDGAYSVNVTWNVSVRETYVPTLLDFAPCAIYIFLGLLLGIWYGIRTGRIPKPARYTSIPPGPPGA
jgi:hypothetical protein